MCMGNPSESGHGGQFKPCQRYMELRDKCFELERKCKFNESDKGPAKRYNLYFDSSAKNNLEVEGWYRRDLEKPNWHYYEAKDGVIIHCRKEHILFVVEEEIKDASDE